MTYEARKNQGTDDEGQENSEGTESQVAHRDSMAHRFRCRPIPPPRLAPPSR